MVPTIQDEARRGRRIQHQNGHLWIAFVPLMLLGCATTLQDPAGVWPLASEQEEQAATAALKGKAERFRQEQEKRLTSVAARLAIQMENLPALTFQVVDGEEINAYTNNGTIKVTLAMMRFLRSDAELAVIVGHELGHLAWERAGTLLGGRSLKDVEREADLQGLICAFKAGYDVRAAAELWSRMAVELSGARARPWRSHPSFAERFIVAQKVARRLLTSSPMMVEEKLKERPLRQLREKTEGILAEATDDHQEPELMEPALTYQPPQVIFGFPPQPKMPPQVTFTGCC